MRQATFLAAVLGALLLPVEAAAQLPLQQLPPGREVRVAIMEAGASAAIRHVGTLVRATADTLHVRSGEQLHVIPRSSIVALEVSLGRQRVLGASAIVGAGTFVAGGAAYMVVMADDRVSNFWEIGPLVVVPAAAVGFVLGGTIGALLGRPRPQWQPVRLAP
jgi:hypothetical protein